MQTSDQILRTIAEQFVGKRQDDVRTPEVRNVVRLLVIHNLLGLHDDGSLGLTEKALAVRTIDSEDDGVMGTVWNSKTVTEFLTKHCKGTYRSVTELLEHADELFPGELATLARNKTKAVLQEYIRKYPDGNMPNGLAYYTELPVGGHRGKETLRSKSGKNIALIQVGRRM